MARELYDNTEFNAEDDPLVAIKKFIQWFRGDGRGETGSGAAGVPVTPSGSFSIPSYDQQVFDYYGSTNNIETITYKNGATTVAILTFTYIGGVPASDDANVATITQS